MQGNNITQSEDLLEELNSLMFNYYYSLSTIAAAKGDYALAGKYISDLLKSNGEIPILLELQAKIFAQQGKFKEAEFLWKKCLQTEPDNIKYISALKRMNKLLRSKAMKFGWNFRLLLKVAVSLLFLFLFFLFIHWRVEIKEQLSSLNSKQDALNLKIDSLQNFKLIENDLLNIIMNRLTAIKGLSIKQSENEIVVVFDEGLFSKGIEIIPNQTDIVLKLSKMLEPFAGKIDINILGSADNIPITRGKYQSNNALCIARAYVIYDLLYENSRIPCEDLNIGSLSISNSTFSNNNYESRLKNRTVVIKIIPKE